MKAVLKFDLNDPSDRLEHARVMSATDLYIAVSKFDNKLRSMLKYGAIIDSGQQIALPEGYHTIQEKESELLHAVVDIIRSELYRTLEGLKIDMENLE